MVVSIHSVGVSLHNVVVSLQNMGVSLQNRIVFFHSVGVSLHSYRVVKGLSGEVSTNKSSDAVSSHSVSRPQHCLLQLTAYKH